MTDLPSPLSAYFAAEADVGDEAFMACFAPNAVVHDEAREYRGIAAIVAWRQQTRAKTPFTSRVLDWTGPRDDIVVETEVSGSFPNSPVRLDQRFALADGVIRTLDIR